MTGFQRLCIATSIVIVGLIILGGVVRATDSGLGCPDWPLCHGHVIPEFEKHTLIEWSHRTVAAVVGFMVLGINIVAFRNYRRVPAILYPSILAGVLLLIQAGLGGAAVLNELPAEVIMVHLGMAMTILTLLMVITFTSLSMSGKLRKIEVRHGVTRVALAALAGTLVLMLVGSYVSGAGYGLACAGWPLCNGQVVPSDGGASVHTHFLHRFLALIVGLTLVGLIWTAWKVREEAPMVFKLSLGAGIVFVVQSLIGAANIWTQLADPVTALHLAFATVLWLHLAILNIRAGGWHEKLPRSSASSSPNPDLARAAR